MTTVAEVAARAKSPLPLVISGIAPVDGTRLGIGVVVFEAYPVPRMNAQDHRVAHLRLGEFEPLGQHDARAMLFASYRVLDGLNLDVPHLRNAHRGAAANASQRPWVGRALNWQGQPQAQLQLPTSSPTRRQGVFAVVLIARSSSYGSMPVVCGSCTTGTSLGLTVVDRAGEWTSRLGENHVRSPRSLAASP